MIKMSDFLYCLVCVCRSVLLALLPLVLLAAMALPNLAANGNLLIASTPDAAPASLEETAATG